MSQKILGRALLLRRIVCLLTMGSVLAAVHAQEGVDILKITIGKSTLLDDMTYQNAASVAVSRTGVVAAFYPKAPRHYRTSIDGGVTWGPQMDSPMALAGGAGSVALRDGGVLKFLTTDTSFKGEAQFHESPMEGEYKDGWFTLHSTFAWFNDDFTEYEVDAVQVYMPDAVTAKQVGQGVSFWPIFDKGKILQLENGNLLAPMYGVFKGDTKSRVILSTSSDRGHKWRYYATVAVDPIDPNPELPGAYNGPCEPTIELLPNGKMICVMRTQGAHLPAEYRPMSVCWSDNLGKTWTKPQPTNPHLMTIWPTVQTLDNGVVACQYGRPGLHVAFSLDNGHTWQDRISFSHVAEPYITGQFDMVKAGPNQLVVIGNDTGWRQELADHGYPRLDGDEAGGLKVWPITVERLRVSPDNVSLQGRVLDQQGDPIVNAKVECSPNRYAADDWIEHETERDLWNSAPMLIGDPRLAFRLIQSNKNFPTGRTDKQGYFHFDNVKLGEYVLTVEAVGHAPQQRHINVRPELEPMHFILKPGQLVRGRIVDDRRQPISGVCVVLNHWHTHTDLQGYYHWSAKAPVLQWVAMRVYKRYSGQYETLETTIALSQIQRQPIVLNRK